MLKLLLTIFFTLFFSTTVFSQEIIPDGCISILGTDGIYRHYQDGFFMGSYNPETDVNTLYSSSEEFDNQEELENWYLNDFFEIEAPLVTDEPVSAPPVLESPSIEAEEDLPPTDADELGDNAAQKKRKLKGDRMCPVDRKADPEISDEKVRTKRERKCASQKRLYQRNKEAAEAGNEKVIVAREKKREAQKQWYQKKKKLEGDEMCPVDRKADPEIGDKKDTTKRERNREAQKRWYQRKKKAEEAGNEKAIVAREKKREAQKQWYQKNSMLRVAARDALTAGAEAGDKEAEAKVAEMLEDNRRHARTRYQRKKEAEKAVHEQVAAAGNEEVVIQESELHFLLGSEYLSTDFMPGDDTFPF